jgi:hypothetical protein
MHAGVSTEQTESVEEESNIQSENSVLSNNESETRVIEPDPPIIVQSIETIPKEEESTISDEEMIETIPVEDIIISILKEKDEFGILNYKVLYKSGDKGWIASTAISVFELEKLRKKFAKKIL